MAAVAAVDAEEATTEAALAAAAAMAMTTTLYVVAAVGESPTRDSRASRIWQDKR